MRIERTHVNHTPAQLFDLVADVERFPEFLPWVVAAHVRRRDAQTLWTDMTMGTRFIRRQFSTVAHLDRPHRIDISSHDPMFERFEQKWTFEPDSKGGTTVEYRVDFKFRSRVLQRLIGASFSDRAVEMIHAFRHRARVIYGPH